ncbi:MAG: NADPH:quinone oxidoreductase family protein [Pseudomonadota bacterium]|nr:NADPH:quinone oxidoreductase family protein [Pseudomonadota bacterium]
MRAIVVNEFGPVESHNVEECPDRTPGEGEVLIENHAIGLNFPDILMLGGEYQKRPDRPFVPGRDCAGIVRAVGPGVTRSKPGDRVVAQVFTGAFGELVPAPQQRCFVLPDAVSFEDAAAMITVFNTAWVAMDTRARLRAGETVMVTGAAGGVGSATVQLCKARGAIVIAAVSSDEKGELAKAHGADFVVLSRADDLEALKQSLKSQVNAITGADEGRGCDVIIDTVGGDLFEAGLRVLRFAGRMVVVGFASGKVAAAQTNYLLYNNLTVMGAPLDIHFDMAFNEIERGVNTWLSLLASSQIRANISERYPLNDFVAAFDSITGPGVKGRTIIDPRS